MKKEITELLENYEVQPSERCWEALSRQLSATQPSTQSQPDTSAAQQAGSSIKDIFLQKSGMFWVKTAAIVATSVTATTVAVVAIINAVQTNPTPQPAPGTPNPVVVIQEGSSMDNLPEATLKIAFQEKATEPIVARAEAPVVAKSVTLDTSSMHLPSTSLSVNSISVVAQPVIQQTTAASTPMPTTGDIASAQPAAPPQNSTPPPAQSIAQAQKDPVIEELADDAIDQTPTVAIEIPNVFTPNGDGINEYFVIGGLEHCEKAELIIRNANKSVVFHTKHYENNWNADNLNNGMYYYTFSYVINGIPQVRHGVISVMR